MSQTQSNTHNEDHRDTNTNNFNGPVSGVSCIGVQSGNPNNTVHQAPPPAAAPAAAPAAPPPAVVPTESKEEQVDNSQAVDLYGRLISEKREPDTNNCVICDKPFKGEFGALFGVPDNSWKIPNGGSDGSGSDDHNYCRCSDRFDNDWKGDYGIENDKVDAKPDLTEDQELELHLKRAAQLEAKIKVEKCIKEGFKYDVNSDLKTSRVGFKILGPEISNEIKALRAKNYAHADSVQLMFASSLIANFL